jgi:hypothetical protein
MADLAARCATQYWDRSDHDRLPLAVLPPGEHMLLHALSHIDVERFILTIIATFPSDADPMQRLDPLLIAPVEDYFYKAT